jgi:hypothetical protein
VCVCVCVCVRVCVMFCVINVLCVKLSKESAEPSATRAKKEQFARASLILLKVWPMKQTMQRSALREIDIYGSPLDGEESLVRTSAC